MLITGKYFLLGRSFHMIAGGAIVAITLYVMKTKNQD